MRPGRHLFRWYILLAGCCLAAGFYYLVVTLPLIREERMLDQRLLDSISRLAQAGSGMSTAEVTEKIELLEADIEAFSAIGRDKGRTIQFSPEVEEMLARPFQLFEFNHEKFTVVERILALSRERGVAMPEQWQARLPVPERQQPYQLWAQLVVMEQLLVTAIQGGVARIDDFELVFIGRNEADAEMRELEVAVRMQLTGPMEAIHSVLMMLPLNGEELEALEIDAGEGPQSSFFLSRFILKKSSAENPDEVSFDFVASGYLESAPAL